MIRIPDGTLLKNSTKPISGFKYNHPFDGHGFINAFTFKNGEAKYKGIRVKTDHYKIEKKYNRQIFRGLNTNVKYNRLFVENFSNISVFHDTTTGDVQSLSEGGIPYLIDIDTQETIGRKFKNLPPFMPYFPITAHPKIDNGKVVNASGMIGMMALFDDDGIIFVERFPENKTYYFHDFFVTPRHYIFYLNNVSLDILPMYFSDEGTILDGLTFNNTNKLLIVDKVTKERQYINIPIEYDTPSLHIAHVEYIDGDTLSIYLPLIPRYFDLSNVETARDFSGCYLHKMVVRNGDVCSMHKLSNIHCEMPIQTGKYIFLINENTLLRHDLETSKTTIKKFDCIIEEPIAQDGVLFVIGHDVNTTTITVLHQDTMETIHSHVFPFETTYGFHGTFVPKNI